ncbi:related to JEM1-DnaJ-like chaperone required for nuclear membrane fusion during mating [Zygosaccharomyces bailii ISA1307]|nr:related to JEM1-DnaJ-like chaperone required for nuclear membrane fusion during mating [Zygosaccharomyces bailii ISA1307]
MFLVVLIFLCVCVSGIQCDIKNLQNQVQSLKLDADSQSVCQKLLLGLKECDGNAKQHLQNQIYYRLGLIQLSLNQEWKAIGSFESVDQEDSFGQPAKRALERLYTQYGVWDKVEGSLKDEFVKLNSSSSSLSIDALREMLKISPYDYYTRTLMRVALLKKLRQSLDVSSAQEFIANSEVILEKHATKLDLSQRISLHFEAAVIQMFVVNSTPTHLRKCLALDMDYEPCKKLTLLNTRLGKINPSRSQILDPEVYAFDEGKFDWQKIVSFYLVDEKPCAKIPKGYHFENNYKLINDMAQQYLSEVLDISMESDFQRFIGAILCQASCQAPKTKKLTNSFCKKLLKDELTSEKYKKVLGSARNDDQLPEKFLENLWNSSPNLAMYAVESIMHKGAKKSASLQDQLSDFFQRQKLSQSTNKYVRTQVNSIDGLLLQRQQQQQQQQRQQQEWFFRQQQQQQQKQQQQRQQPPPPPLQTDKDYYKILNVPKTATAKEIRKAYLSFTKMYHPDKQGQISEEKQREIDEKMSEINEAYETLSDESKRKEYDVARTGGGRRSGAPAGGMFRQQGGNPFQFNQNFKFNFGF